MVRNGCSIHLKKLEQPTPTTLTTNFGNTIIKPDELWSNHVIDQKINYTHANPVEAGFVEHEHEFLRSSARDYAGMKGLIKVTKA